MLSIFAAAGTVMVAVTAVHVSTAGAIAYTIAVSVPGAGAVTDARAVAGAIAHTVAVAVPGTKARAVAHTGAIAGSVTRAVTIPVPGAKARAVAKRTNSFVS